LKNYASRLKLSVGPNYYSVCFSSGLLYWVIMSSMSLQEATNERMAGS
jgi:hypothetical protein